MVRVLGVVVSVTCGALGVARLLLRFPSVMVRVLRTPVGVVSV
jgi:hypothetical protein